jgi:hypothetical protein
MSFFKPVTEQDLEFNGFHDGQNLTIPEGTELTAVIYDGFNGMEEGKAAQVCHLNISVTTEGEFFGQKYKYSAKIYDMDAGKRDLAMRNLQVVDAQAGLPMTTHGMDLTTENIKSYWAGRSEVRVKFGLMISEKDGREINFVRGFGYYREKMHKPAAPAPAARSAPAPAPAPALSAGFDDIDF